MLQVKTQYENIAEPDFGENEDSSTTISPKKWNVMRKLSWVVALSFLFMLGEALGGYLANSLAVMSDAAHLFSDVCGYALSLVAVYLSTRPKSESMPFGFIRAEIIGALCSVLFLWVVLFHLFQEGIERLSNPEAIDGKLMFIISSCGLFVNLLMGFILVHCGHSHSHGLRKCDHMNAIDDDDMQTPLSPSATSPAFDVNNFTLSMNTSKKCTDAGCSDNTCAHSLQSSNGEEPICSHDMDNLNIRAAYVHVIADTMQSLGVVVSSALIWYDSDSFAIMDPICTLVFAGLGFTFSLNIMNDIISIFMLRTPKSLDIESLRSEIESLDARILNVDDLRVWGITANELIMTCRISTRSDSLNKPSFFDEVKKLARKRGINDATIQVENLSVRQKRAFSLIGKRRFGSS